MSRSGGMSSPEVLALLDRERDLPAAPPLVRARALARARAALASRPALWSTSGAAPSRHRGAAAAAAICILSAAVGAAAYEIGARLAPARRDRGAGSDRPAGSDREARPTLGRAPLPAAVALPSAVANPDHDLPTPPARAIPSRWKAEGAREELRLLRQARAAVARSDFAAALPLLVEHARRFKEGSLAEEREALRVKALAGLGRIDEARHAAAAFGARFPRSVLLPAVDEMATARMAPTRDP